LSLPATTLGAIQSTSVRLTADGGSSLQLASISSLASPFSLTHNCPDTLVIGSYCDLTIAFAPVEPGAHSQSVNVAANATISGAPFQISAYAKIPSCIFDVDGDGKLLSTTDGLMLTRYLLGLRGNALISGAIGNGGTRLTSQQVENYLSMMVGNRMLDVDANGVVDPLTDVAIIVRALAGMTGNTVTAGALSTQPLSVRSAWVGGPPGTNLRSYLSENCALIVR
jgi:hypothetical protein